MKKTRLPILAILLLLVIVSGTLGYQLIEGWNLLDSLYQTLITLSTVGFGEVKPLSPQGKLFTIMLVVIGISFVTYAATQLVQVVIEGKIGEIIGKRKMKQALKNLRNHYIICGYGRIGVVVAENLRLEGMSLVIVDKEAERVQAAIDKGFVALRGDATQESVLMEAGIKQAKGIAAVLPDDPDNLYLTITARSLNPGIRVAAKAMTSEGAKRLEKVGTDTVIPLYTIGGERMSVALTRPEVLDFIDIAHGRDRHIRLEEIRLPSGCRIAGQSIAGAKLREKYGITVLVIKRGQEIIIPGPSDTLAEGDVLLVMGEMARVQRFLEERA